MVRQASLERRAPLAPGQLRDHRQLVQAVWGARSLALEPAEEGQGVVEVAEVSPRPVQFDEASEEGREVLAQARASSRKSLGDFSGSLLDQDAGLSLELGWVEGREQLALGRVWEPQGRDPGSGILEVGAALGGAAQEATQGGHEVDPGSAHARAAS